MSDYTEDWTPPKHDEHGTMPYPLEKADRVKAFVAYSWEELPDGAKSNLQEILDLVATHHIKFRYHCTLDKYDRNILNRNIRSYYKGEWEVYMTKDSECATGTHDLVTRAITGWIDEPDIYRYLRHHIKRTFENFWIKFNMVGARAVALRAIFGEDLYKLPKFMLIYTKDGVEEFDKWKGNWENSKGVQDEVLLANQLKIPVINLHNDDCVERVREKLIG